MRRTPPAPRRGAGARLSTQAIQQGCVSFPGLAHRMEQVGRKGRVLFVNDSKATNADSRAQALACFTDIFWIAGGKPKTGGIASLAGFFPRIRKAYLIGEAAAEFAASSRQVPHESPARSTARSNWRRAMRKPPMSKSRWCCCLRPARRSTSTAISRCAATSSASWCWRCRV
jgi:UDP-N-acetylmuramoylalanine-D-glutamate ligase